MKSFTELQAWKVGIKLVKEIYTITKSFPKDELFGLTSQIRRASTSILANLAEGFSRHTDADKAHKYTISRGECSEVKALLLIAIELGFISDNQGLHMLSLCEETGRLLSGLQRSYAPNPSPNPNPPVP